MIRFDPNQVAFEQTNCPICWNKFEIDEAITTLACKHIYHPGCLPNSLRQCPTCSAPIAIKESDRLLDEDADGKVIRAARVLFTGNTAPETLAREFIKFFREGDGMLEFRDRNDLNIFFHDFSNDIFAINNRDTAELRRVVQKHILLMKPEVLRYINAVAVTITKTDPDLDFIKAMLTRAAQFAGFKLEISEDYLRELTHQLKHSEIQEKLNERQRTFVQLNETFYATSSGLQGIHHFYKMDASAQEVLIKNANQPVAAAVIKAKKIKETVELITILVALGLMASLFLDESWRDAVWNS